MYALTIFLSAFLLFQVQPILAKLVLPWFGGAAAVWTISVAFYQLVYLLGNLYAHVLVRRLGPRASARTHAIALLLSLLLLPILPNPLWQPQGSEEPTWRILGLLAATIGAPFVLLSATSPLLQTWYVRGRAGARPYRLYALSNAGSLLALLSYPVLVEPLVTTRHQAWAWSAGYGVCVLLGSFIAFRQTAAASAGIELHAGERPALALQLLWLGLAATASALLLSVTHHISQNIAAVPLLWIFPLALYLLSLILCFDGHRWYRRAWCVPALMVLLVAMAYALLPRFENERPAMLIPLFCAGLFVCCMTLHGEMAGLKPSPRFLTTFYLMASAGGAIGGIFVAVVAPRIFRGYFELPVSLTSCALLTVVALYHGPAAGADRPRPWGPALAVLAALFAGFVFYVARSQGDDTRVMVRNFYGVLRVDETPATLTQPRLRQLRNGTIIHGVEILDSSGRDVPNTYYGPLSGVALALTAARQHGSLHVGVIGLGTGTLALYGRRGDRYSFYELNPLVVNLARTQFDFLSRSQADIQIVAGDARLSLQRQPPQQFDVLIVDAFSGDAIPVHLLTREAFDLYFRHLKADGVLAVHVTNRYLDLPPIVEAAARLLGARARSVSNADDDAATIYHSTWMLVDRSPGPSDATGSGRAVRPWTDDYSNLVQILK